ncbi:MAG: hypothetical protein FJ213_08325 [Ignavibacteria bacterium]|nr:hypothetical protein [Ignavibacteria bacterium]
MVKYFLMIIMLIHGLIHIIGFVKEFKLAEVSQLSGKTLFPLTTLSAKAAGLFWLISCLLFAISAGMYLFEKDWWWIFALAGILISQVLIIIYWQDAKFGTIANIIILFAAVLAYGNWIFYKSTNDELMKFYPPASSQTKFISDGSISHLPAIVQKWLVQSNVVGKPIIQKVKLNQKGSLRTSPDGKWMDFFADQYFTTAKPGFIWIADVKAFPLIHLFGKDKYESGKGEMLIKLFGLIPVVNSKGDEISQGALLRYLAEIIWIPSNAVMDYIQWEEIDSLSAKATMNYGNISASGIFRYSQNGDFLSFTAKRFYERKEGATLEDWYIETDTSSYKTFHGIRFASKSKVTWKLNSGDFNWLNLEITEIDYD